MTVDELRVEAEAVRAKGHAYMIMVMHRSAEPRGGTVRLLGREGPKGRFVGAEIVAPGRVKVIGDFLVADILKWCDKHRSGS